MRTTRIKSGLPLGLVSLSLVGLAATLWTQISPARAQDEKPPAPAGIQAPAIGAPASAIAASGEFVYVLRGSSVYQLKAADLSIAAQKDLSSAPVAVKEDAKPPH